MGIIFFLVGWDWVHLVMRPLFDLLYHPRMIDDECGAVGGMRIPKYSEKTCPSATLSTRNATLRDPGSNPVAAVGSRRLIASAETVGNYS
jgi:hypothetical protein